MTKQLQKLELTWIDKGKESKLEPRILIEDPGKSFGDMKSENMLIHGDNLLALRALEQQFTGRIKCINVDPPFNTGSAFEHYDDGVEHSLWLNLMKHRLELLKNLLSNDGSIYIHIDNNEQAYLKVIMDEIFGRRNFVQMISVKRASPAGFKVINPGPLTVTDYILLYAKNKDVFNYYPQRIPVGYDDNYDCYILNPNDRPSDWVIEKLVDVLYKQYNFKDWKDAKAAWGNNWKDVRNSLLGDLAIEKREVVVSVRDPHKPSDKIKELMVISKSEPNKVFTIEREKYNPIYIYNGGSLSFYKEKLREIDGVLTPTELLTDFWNDINFAGIAKEGGVQFKNSKKPEMLVKRVFELATRKDDWVLDSFLGSGTTAAVAHKMKRKWIGIELGDHAITHCLPRLKSIVNGTDQSGISKSVEWRGGGGFKFYTLAPSLIQKDKYGNDIINPVYNANMLAAAMAKQEGFRYAPHDSIYWKQGNSSEKDFIFTTTQFITVEMLDRLAEEMHPNENLLICCKGFKTECKSRHSNITIKKIPQMLYGRCEFGKDDYSFNIVNLPHDETDNFTTNQDELTTEESIYKKSKTKQPARSTGEKKEDESQPSLF